MSFFSSFSLFYFGPFFPVYRYFSFHEERNTLAKTLCRFNIYGKFCLLLNFIVTIRSTYKWSRLNLLHFSFAILWSFIYSTTKRSMYCSVLCYARALVSKVKVFRVEYLFKVIFFFVVSFVRSFVFFMLPCLLACLLMFRISEWIWRMDDILALFSVLVILSYCFCMFLHKHLCYTLAVPTISANIYLLQCISSFFTLP